MAAIIASSNSNVDKDFLVFTVNTVLSHLEHHGSDQRAAEMLRYVRTAIKRNPLGGQATMVD